LEKGPSLKDAPEVEGVKQARLDMTDSGIDDAPEKVWLSALQSPL